MRSVPAALLAASLACGMAASLPALASEKTVDYGDMRCAFAIKQRAHMDSQIVSWARGYLDGYARAMMQSDLTASIGANGPALPVNDEAILANQLRAFCLRHHDRTIADALVRILDRIGIPVEASPARQNHAGALPASMTVH